MISWKKEDRLFPQILMPLGFEISVLKRKKEIGNKNQIKNKTKQN
jgi:hypothetical protein